MQALFTVLIAVQFLVVVLHDWVDIPGWTSARQVQRVVGIRKLLVASVINAVFPGLAVGLAFWFYNAPKPAAGVVDYWILYCAITLGSAIGMWYVPYIWGASEKTKREYGEMYAGTVQVLPERGGNPRPNLLHLCFHGLFVVTFVLAVGLRVRG